MLSNFGWKLKMSDDSMWAPLMIREWDPSFEAKSEREALSFNPFKTQGGACAPWRAEDKPFSSMT